MNTTQSIIVSLVALALTSLPCPAKHKPEQAKTEAGACRLRSNEAKQLYESLTFRDAYHMEFMRADLPMVKAAFDDAAAAWAQAADAYDEQDDAADTLRAQAEKMGARCLIWRERLDIREKQALAAPREDVYLQHRYDGGPQSRAALAVQIEARKDAADAWGALAEAINPDAEPGILVVLREKAMQTAGEVDIAQAAHAAVDRRERLAREFAASPRAAAALESLKKLDDERAAALREEVTRAAHLRDLDRRRAALEEQIRQK